MIDDTKEEAPPPGDPVVVVDVGSGGMGSSLLHLKNTGYSACYLLSLFCHLSPLQKQISISDTVTLL